MISLVHVNQYVYIRGRSGVTATKGHCINFAQNISSMATALPRLAADVNIVVIRRRGTDNRVRDLRVRRRNIQVWLEWLSSNSIAPGYRGLVVSQRNLDLLPEDDFIELPTRETDQEPDLNSHVQVSAQNEQSAQGQSHVQGEQQTDHADSCEQLSQRMSAVELDAENCAAEEPPIQSVLADPCEQLSQQMSSVDLDAGTRASEDLLDDDQPETTHTGVTSDFAAIGTETEDIQAIVNDMLNAQAQGVFYCVSCVQIFAQPYNL